MEQERKEGKEKRRMEGRKQTAGREGKEGRRGWGRGESGRRTREGEGKGEKEELCPCPLLRNDFSDLSDLS